MSMYLVNKVLDLHLQPVAKLVMAVLADYANDARICKPRIAKIAERASVSERTAQRVISRLQKQGFLVVQARYRPDGSQGSNEYLLFPDENDRDDKLSPLDTPPAAPEAPEEVADTPSTQTEPNNESKLHTTDIESGCSGSDVLHIPSCFPAVEFSTMKALLNNLPNTTQQQLLDEVAENHRLHPTKTIPLRLLRFLAAAARQGQFRPELCFLAEQRRAVRIAACTPAPPANAPPSLTPEQVAERIAAVRAAMAPKKPQTEIGEVDENAELDSNDVPSG